MIKENRVDFNRKVRADNQEIYRKELFNYIKKEIVNPENELLKFIQESYNKGSYIGEFCIDISLLFVKHIESADYTPVTDMFSESALKGFIQKINIYLLNTLDLKNIVDNIESKFETEITTEYGDYTDNTYKDDVFKVKLTFKD